MSTYPLTLPHLCFYGITISAAHAAFIQRFGVEPVQVVESRGYIYAGPIPGNQAEDYRNADETRAVLSQF